MEEKSGKALDDVWTLEAMAFVARALSHPLRIAILEVLGEEGSYVMDLVVALGRPQANVSQHLMVLREAGLVIPEREGTAVRYRVSDKQVLALLAFLRDVTQQLPQPEDVEDQRPLRPWGRRFRRRRGRW